ncbi:hypothetical protein U1701_07705 [Sphingomonas sp. PB2P19]|uniref:hypothetical protein n=1 Tax=Sphingomonas rhamnosi TaxID=3096156 RepID=UPI002FC9C4A8
MFRMPVTSYFARVVYPDSCARIGVLASDNQLIAREESHDQSGIKRDGWLEICWCGSGIAD